MKSFKRYIKEVAGAGPGGGDARSQAVDSDTGTVSYTHLRAHET